MKTLNYRHSLETINSVLSSFNMKFNVIAEGSNKQNKNGLVFILKEEHKETGKLTQTCGHFYSASDAVEFVNGLSEQ